MVKLLDLFFKQNAWKVFGIIISLYCISLALEFKFIFTESFYLDSLESQYDIGRISDIIVGDKNTELINYPISLLIVLFPTLMIAFSLNIGAVLFEYKIKFVELFKICIKGQLVFAINYFVATLLKCFNVLDKNYYNINNNYDFQSFTLFLSKGEYPIWILYPLQCINIAEILHILILSYGILWLTGKKFSKSISFVLIFYGLALLFWIIFTVFIASL